MLQWQRSFADSVARCDIRMSGVTEPQSARGLSRLSIAPAGAVVSAARGYPGALVLLIASIVVNQFDCTQGRDAYAG